VPTGERLCFSATRPALADAEVEHQQAEGN
jgi:hypothetical protein